MQLVHVPMRPHAGAACMRACRGQHLVMVLSMGVPGLLIFSLGVPAFSAWFLRRHRHELRHRPVYQCYGFMYTDYEDRHFYWVSGWMPCPELQKQTVECGRIWLDSNMYPSSAS